MASLKTLLENFVEEYSLGRVGTTTSTGDTTSLIDLTRFGRPSAGNEFQRNSPIRITSRAAVVGGGITIGSEVFTSDFDPSTGDFTVTPAMNDTPEVGTGFIATYANVTDSTDRFVEALNRFLTRVARRQEKVPITMAGQAATLLGATSLWTLSNATAAYVAGDALYYQHRRWLGVSATGSPGYAEAGGISVTEDDVIDFYVTVFPSGTGTAGLTIRDETAGATITPTYIEGAATLSAAKPRAIRGYFTVPAGCSSVAFRLDVSTSGQTGLFGPLFVQNRNTLVLPVPVELGVPKQIGQLYQLAGLPGEDAVAGQQYNLEPLDIGYTADQRSWGNVIEFTERPPFPLLLEAQVPYAALVAGDPTAASAGTAASESDTTDCPERLAIAGMAVEFFKWAQREERMKRGPDSHSTRWDGRLADAEAELALAQADVGAPKRITTVRRFAGRASA